MTQENPPPEPPFVDTLPKNLQPVWNATKKEASALGYNLLTAEHVLAGLVSYLAHGAEGSPPNTVGGRVWMHLGINEKKLQGILPKKAGPRPGLIRNQVAPAVENLFGSVVMEAHLLNQIPGPEHLLLALFRNDQTRHLLEKVQITREDVLSAITAVRKEEGAPPNTDGLPESRALDEVAKNILRLATAKAKARGQNAVGAEHLLATVLEEEEAVSNPNSPILRAFTEVKVPVAWFTKVLNLAIGNDEPKPKGEPALTMRANSIIKESIDRAYRKNAPVGLVDIFRLICNSSDSNQVIKEALECFDLSLPKIQEALKRVAG